MSSSGAICRIEYHAGSKTVLVGEGVSTVKFNIFMAGFYGRERKRNPICEANYRAAVARISKGRFCGIGRVGIKGYTSVRAHRELCGSCGKSGGKEGSTQLDQQTFETAKV